MRKNPAAVACAKNYRNKRDSKRPTSVITRIEDATYSTLREHDIKPPSAVPEPECQNPRIQIPDSPLTNSRD